MQDMRTKPWLLRLGEGICGLGVLLRRIRASIVGIGLSICLLLDISGLMISGEWRGLCSFMQCLWRRAAYSRYDPSLSNIQHV